MGGVAAGLVVICDLRRGAALGAAGFWDSMSDARCGTGFGVGPTGRHFCDDLSRAFLDALLSCFPLRCPEHQPLHQFSAG